MKIVRCGAILAIATACTASQGYIATPMQPSDQAVLERAFAVGLKDPGSAETQSVQAFQAPNGNRTICGIVNAKNSFGGFNGYQTFVVTTVAGVDYSQPYARPIFGLGGVAAIDCGGVGFKSPL